MRTRHTKIKTLLTFHPISIPRKPDEIHLQPRKQKMQSKTRRNITTFFVSSVLLILFFSKQTTSDPQTNLLTKDCVRHDDVLHDQSYYNFIARLSANLNATLSDLRSQLNASHFATAHRPSIYALFQCRDYLSSSDCISCFSSAALEIQRNCPSATTSSVYYDGCYLRYDGGLFFDVATQSGYQGFCGNRTVADGSNFNQTADVLLRDLSAAAPRSRGFFAAAKMGGVGNGSDAVVYGVAQCAHTVTDSACHECLETARGNIKNCPPSADGRAVDVGCFLRYSRTAFFNDDQITDLTALLGQKGGSKKSIMIGVVVAALILTILGAFFVLLLIRRRRKAKEIFLDLMGATELRGPVKFHYQELRSATQNFSGKNKVGKGGFGDVYLGVMRNNRKVAIKKLAIDKSRQAREDFEKEVKIINNVHHRNLVRLLGYCSKGTEYLLVYEYMENSSLDKFLFGNSRGSLNWKQRFDIIVGIARGLAYLHEEFHICIIHRDIKTTNILLDEELQPKIADFGLARLLPADKSHLNTRFAGTLGYMAPEYVLLGLLSEKVDVYSYGMVVLEIISGQKSNDVKHEPVMEYLLNWAWRLYEEDSLAELVDENLDPNEYEIEEVKKVIEIALMCTQSVTSRPAMSEVVVWLLNKDKMELKLTRPKFINAMHTLESRAPQRQGSNNPQLSPSHATMSITELSVR